MRRAERLLGHLQRDASPTIAVNVSESGEQKRILLTAEQKRHYEEEGWIMIKGLVPQSDIDKYTKRFLEISNGQREAPPFMTVMRDVALAKAGASKAVGEGNITKLQNLNDDEVLWHYCEHPRVLEVTSQLIGPNLRAIHTMLINKPPDLGVGSSRHPPHQDLWYFPIRPADKILAAWTAMQKIDRENGCLFVLPRSHKGELLKHEYPLDGIVNKAYHGIQNMSSEAHGEKMLHVEMEAGDTIFFHPLLIHGSGRNNSKRFRKAISCHYAATDCHWIDVSETIQAEVAEEIEAIARKRGIDISYIDIWRAKSKLVAGEEGQLQ